MRKISEVLRLRFELKRTYRDIASSLNIGISTVHDYLAKAKMAGIGWPLPADMDEETLFKRLFLPVDNPIKNRPLPDWERVILEMRKKAMTLRLLWREYRDAHPQGLGYTQFCVHYRAHLKQMTPVMRQIHKAGDKTFVDYAGMTIPWVDCSSGEVHQAQIFVGCLGASQYTFVEATLSQQIADWIGSHIRMWEYFGGVSQIVVPDNLKAGVTKAHRYDPDVNVNYQHMSEHYGVAIVPARVAKPKDKAKVENAVGCIERQILAALRHVTFTSIAQINLAIKPLLAEFNSQSLQKMKTSRKELFETIDKPALKPLPEKYEYTEWSRAKIHIDYHFTFDDHRYSVPYRYIHHEVELRTTAKTVECFYQNKRIAIHERSFARYQFTTVREHMPLAHQSQSEWSAQRLKNWAKKIGPHTHQFINHMIACRSFPEQAFRACLGVMRLGRRFGDDRLEKACAIACEVGMTRYKQIETLLNNKMDLRSPTQTEEEPARVAHDNIRGPHYYQH